MIVAVDWRKIEIDRQLSVFLGKQTIRSIWFRSRHCILSLQIAIILFDCDISIFIAKNANALFHSKNCISVIAKNAVSLAFSTKQISKENLTIFMREYEIENKIE